MDIRELDWLIQAYSVKPMYEKGSGKVFAERDPHKVRLYNEWLINRTFVIPDAESHDDSK